ncbi:MAG: T9SS type A sorting domain-containing protein [Candidatus Latescibacterota bacterium]|nr:MAG: T9SS type A sorting domain-containing protein [Candidatus Latescibacterota bacterium]
MRPTALCLSVILLLSATTIHAQWVEDGVPVTTLFGSSEKAIVVSDDAGGAIIFWQEWVSTDHDIFAQRIDAYGRTLWTTNGVIVCDEPQSQTIPFAMADGNGGAWVVWLDWRNLNYDIYINHIDGNGTLHWGSSGYDVCTASGDQNNPMLVPDGVGGVVVVWHDARLGDNIYAERVHRVNGKPWGITNGSPVCDNLAAAYPHAVFDGVADVYVVWRDERNIATSGQDIYLQKLSTYSGNRAFGNYGTAVCTEWSSQEYPQIVSDGAGGAIIVWDDNRSVTDKNIYAQRVNDTGAAYWTPGGVVACSTSASQALPKMIEDGSGGVVITWTDYRNSNFDIFAQRLDSSGVRQWNPLGIGISTETGNQMYPQIVSDDAGGAIIVFEDNQVSPKLVTAQRVDASGNVLWTGGGETLCDAVGDRDYYRVATDGAGGAIVSWGDDRYGGTDDIFAQQIASNGQVGFMAPEIEAVRDVPGDQGGVVYLAWHACRLDRFAFSEMSHYTVWRAISESAATASLDGSAKLIDDNAFKFAAPGVIRLQRVDGQTYYWEYVAQQDCFYLDRYAMTTPTLFDSTDVANEMHYFQIIGHTTDSQLYWISAVDSGYSVDNLPPAAPQQLTGSYDAAAHLFHLIWLQNLEADLASYGVYRGDNAGFIPSEGNRVASTADTTVLAGPEGWPVDTWFKVSAIDEHGNESPFAVLGPDLVTGAEPLRAKTFSLSQNVPNPFNPETSIEFSLDHEQRVTLSIFDVAGRLVVTLVDEVMPAGPHRTQWSGRNDRGATSPSGVYFVRLSSGDRSITRKAVKLK